jgi:polyribonucleotide nucleotidyltransferase
LALENAPEIVKLQERLIAQCGREKMEFTPAEPAPEIVEEVKRTYESRFIEACGVSEKENRQEAMDMIRAEALEALVETYPEGEKDIKNSFYSIEHDEVRRMVSERGQRIDGRGLEDVRQITCEVGVLPRTHGSAIFTRGQTQALATVTLGTAIDEQRVDDLEGESSKSYMLHYNFPPFSVGEVRPIRGTSRREIGHGALAEKAIRAVIPAPEDFPYTVRIVSEILESNGSSSMATVCSSALALMDAGVPIKTPVAGIAMGLVKDGDKYTILTDILGAEDHHGDMDFKVAGTRSGVTTVQMDLKIPGIPMDVIERIVVQAVAARNHIHDVMDETLRAPREEISSYAPRIVAIQIDREKIRDVIGPGGKMIRSIIEETGAVIDIEDDGTVKIASPDREALEKALARVNAIIEDPEVGKVYNGTVRRIADFGAFVEILPGKDGLLHISEIENRRVERVTDVLKEDDKVDVKVLSVERDGKVRLSRRVLLPDYDPNEVRPPRPERRGSRDGRGSRDSRGSSRDGRRPHRR